MDDSDDYGFDDIILDDQTLAVLDQSEKKYFQETSLSASATLSSEPVNKRLKTSHGWTPGLGSGSISREADDYLPEISLQGDGSYGVSNQMNSMNSSMSRFPPQEKRKEQSAHSGHSSNYVGQASSHHAQPSGFPLPGSRQQFPAHTRQRQPFQNIHAQHQERHSSSKNTNAQNGVELQAQMAELQKKLNELREENSKMQSALKDALDMKLAKEGEVSILRKSIEKASQNHTVQISQLKAEKEKVDAKQVQMQKELKDEVERLRTQYIFRQQELESSVRKPPASVRAKKTMREYPSTPLAVPAAMAGWNGSTSEAMSSRRAVEETPVRPSRLPPVFKASPSKKTRKTPEKPRAGMLPGFENAFETSTPLRSPSKQLDKGKGKVVQDSAIFGPETSNAFRPLSQVSQGPQFQSQPVARHAQQQEIFTLPISSGPFISGQSQTNDQDVDMLPGECDEDLEAEELEPFEPINRKAELCRIILTHSHTSTGQIAFQQLISSSHFVDSNHNYSTSCARILEVISNSAKSDDYEASLLVVSTSLLSLLAVLSETQQLLSLAVLLNLLTKLVLSLPNFQKTLLSCQISVQDEELTIIDIVCKLILKHLDPTTAHPQRDDFAADTLSLLESLCFYIRKESMERIEPIAHNREVLMVLLHVSQPTWLLERSSRLLVLLSTHHDLYKTLLNVPSAGVDFGADGSLKDSLIERLCSHLIDTNRPPAENVKIYILIYFAQLSISHSDSHNILGASYALIPSLVLHISHLTTPLWEDDGSLSSSAETTLSLVQALNQTTFLLYHLIFGTEPNLNLRHKLQHAPHRPFSGISHIFVVTFGRLSYCEPPSWMEIERRHELEYLAEIAREILEVVVDGPEGDSVWAAFQTEPDGESTMDEEEMEARLMGVDA
ncbi:hypothetical protein BDZ97DRAFT_1916437 [Flammula alnicola]|nr:hypothetical protein BDZ97DRAFT_1916437 [Flammula alnicola]